MGSKFWYVLLILSVFLILTHGFLDLNGLTVWSRIHLQYPLTGIRCYQPGDHFLRCEYHKSCILEPWHISCGGHKVHQWLPKEWFRALIFYIALFRKLDWSWCRIRILRSTNLCTRRHCYYVNCTYKAGQNLHTMFKNTSELYLLNWWEQQCQHVHALWYWH